MGPLHVSIQPTDPLTPKPRAGTPGAQCGGSTGGQGSAAGIDVLIYKEAVSFYDSTLFSDEFYYCFNKFC